MAKKVRHPVVVQAADSSPIFSSKPHEIFALRRALKWSSIDLGGILGLTHDSNRYTCRSVANWERGRNRPQRVFRIRMNQLANQVKDDYLRVLQKLTEGPKASLYLPIVTKEARRGMKSRLRFISPEQQELINAKTRAAKRIKAPDQGDNDVGKAD